MRHIQANFLLMSLHQASQYYILQFTHLWIWIIQVTKKLLYGPNVPYLQTPTAPYNINARYWTGFMLLVYCALCCFSNDAHIKNFFAVIVKLSLLRICSGFAVFRESLQEILY